MAIENLSTIHELCSVRDVYKGIQYTFNGTKIVPNC